MADEENEINEDSIIPEGKPDFLSGDGIDLGDDDLDFKGEDEGSSLSYGGSRRFEE